MCHQDNMNQDWLGLIKQIQLEGTPRSVQFHPASIKEVGGEGWGYINNRGQFALAPVYTFALPFQANGLAIVAVGNKNALIDEAGHFVVPPIYDNINPFSEGLSAVHDDSGYKIINEEGTVLTTKPYEFIGSFHNGRALFLNKEMKYGYLDRQGMEVIAAQYEQAGDFNAGKAVVQVHAGLYALIDLNGSVFRQYQHYFVGMPGEGMLAFQEKMLGKYGYITEQGRVVIPLTYSGAEPFENGTAVVNIAEDYRNQWGLINKTGTFIIQPYYNEIRRLGEDKLAVGRALDKHKPYLGSKFALYDLSGRKLSDFVYDNILPFTGGLASVSTTSETFFINSSGQQAPGWPILHATGTLTIEGGLIRADTDKRVYYYDHQGNLIWKQNKRIVLNHVYSVQEEKFKPNKDYLVYYPQVEGFLNREMQRSVNNQLKKLANLKEVNESQQLDYDYFGDFSIPFFQKRLLVLKLSSYLFHFGAAHGMPSEIYPHVDLNSGQLYVLKDLFRQGSRYVEVLSGIIERQIQTNSDYSYVWPEQYKGIKADQPFYVTGDALYLYFLPYEIAPFAAGFPTFTIPFGQIMNLIDTRGAFWQSFHS
ncbi:WG repeat-containing protein [Aneurinibacillus sp. Ricciae_BoGa-3]|uniref:WG repeat-containing protein n=1 Tax=Aneurinibacillus sp. Ricciae_BoGa-3 TaxID=3022697 RepID=UPI00234039F9|nr:WG repeat-containing protein [Aneurinibacillus sp. Ricciae_BoGa-3]WCK52654.1 WG repeat-containing protein [Aneurinibacillus sp. Ricciae_BoGa-3]